MNKENNCFYIFWFKWEIKVT